MDIIVDKDYLLRLVCADGMQLQRASQQLRNDPDVAKAAVMQNNKASEFVGERLAADHTFWLAMVLSTEASDKTRSCAWSNIRNQLSFHADRGVKRPRLGLLDDEDLTCPICSDFMTAGISQCTQGHSFCQKCLNAVRKPRETLKCPSCRSPMPDKRIRNLALENIIAVLRGPCSLGCSRVLRLSELSEHIEDECQLRLVTCPLCKDKTILSDFRQHVQTHDPKPSLNVNWAAAKITSYWHGYIASVDHILYFQIQKMVDDVKVFVWHANESPRAACVRFSFDVHYLAEPVAYVTGVSRNLWKKNGLLDRDHPASASISTGGFAHTGNSLTMKIAQLP
jgi:hypothetical protein